MLAHRPLLGCAPPAENIPQELAELGATPEPVLEAITRMMQAGGAATAGVSFTRTLSPAERARLPPMCAAVAQFENLRPGTDKHAEALQALRQLVAKGADVNVSGPLGFTLLHLAAQGGDAEVVEALLAAPGVPRRSPSLWSGACWRAWHPPQHGGREFPRRMT